VVNIVELKVGYTGDSCLCNYPYALAKEGRLPVVRFGKRLPIPKLVLEEMLVEGVVWGKPRKE
jgi:hypothetical protein